MGDWCTNPGHPLKLLLLPVQSLLLLPPWVQILVITLLRGRNSDATMLVLLISYWLTLGASLLRESPCFAPWIILWVCLILSIDSRDPMYLI